MYRKRSRKKKLSARLTSLLSGWWSDLRFFWQTRDKGLFIIGSVLVTIVAAFGFLISSVFANKEDQQNLTCLALNVYFEARGESRAGQLAVAEVTMNRVASRRYPNTLCAVVYQKNWDPIRKREVAAFSWTELHSNPRPKGREWKGAWDVAEAVYYRRHKPQLQGAMYFHATYVRPSWAREKKLVARIDNHIFYK